MPILQQQTLSRPRILKRFQQESINIRGIDVDTVRLWSGRRTAEITCRKLPDILFTISRVSVPEGKDDGDLQKYQKVTWPVLMLFANDTISAPMKPMSPPIAPRTSPDILNEVEVHGTSVEELQKSIVDECATQGYSLVADTSLDTDLIGFYDDWAQVLALKNNDSFVVGTRDATYGLPMVVSGDDVVLTTGSRAVVFGVIKTGEKSLATILAGEPRFGERSAAMS